MSVKSYLYTFLLGGVVVPAAVIVFTLYYIFTYCSVPYTPAESVRKISSLLVKDDLTAPPAAAIKGVSANAPSVTEKTPEKQNPFPAPKRHVRPLQGWMNVRRDFHGREPADKYVENPSSSKSAGSGANATTGATMSTAAARYSSLIKDSYLSFARGSAGAAPQSAQDTSSSTAPSSSSATGGKANSAATTPSGMQEKVFAVLKGKVLFLYSDETKSDCLGALDVEAFSVGISRGDEDDEGDNDDPGALPKSVMREGELFSKRNAIVLRSVPRLGDADAESSPKKRRRARSDALKRSSSAKSVRSTTTAISGMAPSLGTEMQAPTITRKSTEPCVTDLKHMSESERVMADGSSQLPSAIPSLTKDMDDGGRGVSLPGQDEMADAAEARDKTMLQIEQEEKERRRKEKQERDKRRSRIEGRPWYLFLRNNVKMEEWYLSLLSVSAPSVPSASALDDLDQRTKRALERLTARPGVDEIFPKDNMKKLIDKLNTDPDQGNVRWLNGLVGRLFLGICNTVALEAFIIERVMKKINKAKLPGWIEYIRIDEVDVGDVPPTFSQPMLKELTEDGTYAADVHFDYEGEFRLKVSAAGSFSIRGTNLGRATAQLNVRILSIQGNLRIKINKPPSNRVWWCFTEPPQIVMHVEPILASRKMQLNALTRAIEKQIRDGIAEACVSPYCDDLPFFDTSNLKPRGGIFDEFGKRRGQNTVPISTEMGAEGLEPKPAAVDKVSLKSESPARRRSTSLSVAQPTMAAEAVATSTGSTNRHGRSDSDMHFGSSLDRSPTDVASTSSLARSLQDGTKKWFASRASGESTVASSPITLSSHQESIPNLPKRNLTDTRDPSPQPSRESSQMRSQSKASDGDASSAVSAAKQLQDREHASERKAVSGFVPSASLFANPSHSKSPAMDTSTVQPSSAENVPSSDVISSSLMDTIRTRAKDKQALQTSVNQAKDAMRKWGTNWAAKRNLPLGAPSQFHEDPTNVPPTVSTQDRPVTPTLSPSSHRKAETRGMDIPKTGLSLQERLANVTQLATSPDRKPRHSAESDGSSLDAQIVRTLRDDNKTHAHQSSIVSTKVASNVQDSKEPISTLDESQRPSREKLFVAPVASSHDAQSDWSPPKLPPRVPARGHDQRASDDSTSQVLVAVSSSPKETSRVVPPPLPPRVPTESHLPTEKTTPETHKLHPTSTESALPSPSLPRAEEVLKSVMAASQPSGDPQ